MVDTYFSRVLHCSLLALAILDPQPISIFLLLAIFLSRLLDLVESFNGTIQVASKVSTGGPLFAVPLFAVQWKVDGKVHLRQKTTTSLVHRHENREGF